MKKYYRYTRLKYKRIQGRKKFFINILLILCLILMVSISGYIYFSIKTISFPDFLKIDEIKIIKNETTIPDDLIIEKLLQQKINIFSLHSKLKQVYLVFPEINKIKVSYSHIKKIKLSISSEIPLFYSKIGSPPYKIFYSINKKKFIFYDWNKIGLKKIIELIVEKEFNINEILCLHKLLLASNYINEIEKVYTKNNNQFLLKLVNGASITLDRNCQNIDAELLSQTLKLCIENKTNIDARLLDVGKLFLRL